MKKPSRDRARYYLELPLEIDSRLNQIANEHGQTTLLPFIREVLRRVAETGKLPPSLKDNDEDIHIRAMKHITDEVRSEMARLFRQMEEQLRHNEASLSTKIGGGFIATLESTSALKAGLEDIYASVTPGEHKWSLSQLSSAREAIDSINGPSGRVTARVKMAFSAMPGVDRLLSG